MSRPSGQQFQRSNNVNASSLVSARLLSRNVVFDASNSIPILSQYTACLNFPSPGRGLPSFSSFPHPAAPVGRHTQSVTSATSRRFIASRKQCVSSTVSPENFAAFSLFNSTHIILPRAGSGVVRMDPIRFLAGCRTRPLNQC